MSSSARRAPCWSLVRAWNDETYGVSGRHPALAKESLVTVMKASQQSRLMDTRVLLDGTRSIPTGIVIRNNKIMTSLLTAADVI